MISLRRQLAASLAVGTLLLCGLLYLLVASTVRQLAEAQVASRLEHDAETLLAALELAPDGSVRLAAPGPHPIYQRPFSGHYYRVEAAGTLLQSRSLWDTDLPQDARPIVHASGPRGQPLLIFNGRYRHLERDVTIRVAEDLAALERSLAEFQWRYALLNGLLLLALLGLQAVVLRRGLRPLEATRNDLERLERGELSTLPERGPHEIAPLLGAFNAAHAAMTRRLTRSRKALGNLAHALKTPLAVLGQLADDPGLDAQPALRATLRAQAGAIGSAVDRELRRARIAGFAAAGTRVELARVVDDLAATLGLLHRERALAITREVHAGLRLRIDPHDLHELLGNLLDNACKWAQHAVHVSARQQTGELWVTVSDDGPGVPQARLAELTARGSRLDEAVAGHGLGLAIAADIASQYAGRLTFGRGPKGGLAVTLVLPGTLVAAG